MLFSDLVGHINRLEPTHLNITPTIASTFTPDDVPRLKTLILGGEPLHPGILDIWAGRVQVWNNYGPTEGTVMVTTTTVRPGSALYYIGSALPSAALPVRELDSQDEVPHGEIGELRISGSHVARGYLNRPEANEAAFFTGSNGRTVYRTGDLARLLPNGGYALSGRKDDQVKINGYRIELGEVENAIQIRTSLRVVWCWHQPCRERSSWLPAANCALQLTIRLGVSFRRCWTPQPWIQSRTCQQS